MFTDINHFSDKLNKIENSIQITDVTKELNKFWYDYFGVVNLSSHNCSFVELTVLGKGLKFCPTPPVFDHGHMKESIDRFFRSASLKLHFMNEPELDIFMQPNKEDPYSHEKLRPKSKFNPPMPSTLESVYWSVVHEILDYTPSRDRPRNLSDLQYKALLNLELNERIVIKKADKGSNVVIQDRSDYIKECLSQLNDTKFYQKLTRDLTETHYQKVQEAVQELFDNNEISQKTFRFLSEGGKRTSLFYTLPKIHKNKFPPSRSSNSLKCRLPHRKN